MTLSPSDNSARRGRAPLLWAVALASLLPAATARAETTMTAVSNGGQMQKASRDAWYAPFAKARNVKVVEENWSQEYARLRSQVDAGAVTWDVVEITYTNVALGCEDGVLEKIDWSAHLDVADYRAVGGVTECGVPVMGVAGGIVYDGDRIKDGPRTWADFWDLKRWPGKRGLINRASSLEIALMADGVAPKDLIQTLSAPGGVERAFRKLDEIKPAIHWWKSGGESMQILATGEVAMAYAWNGRVAATNRDEKRNLKIVYTGGFVAGNQYLAVVKGSKQKDLAVDFIKFAASAEGTAALNDLMLYLPANTRSLPMVTPALRATLPSADEMQYAYIQGTEPYREYWLAHLESLTQRLARWQSQ